ncbi:MAG: NAD(P)H-dependent oxidoreductase [gamma proteobacterium symbiont of Lucinoma myriamae]|nr:NAD(P)H-dependent oxidoreductase [gamma proteobacterium symbiont of Lucinoma myriamae]MCU7817597.1 NAD(P)H-dependent oxidoreductase [gamma proteobacterium symbiont of Lucinoma myriamae]MCU7833362.1 NAD(P)H-dependent oxidoreductase [gamma proteobacterium symbiont of Lucinoma myriamae]
MKCLIVTTHPLNDSLCKLLGKYVENKLSQIGYEVTVEDLYAEIFEPALSVPERKSYYGEVYDSSNIAEQVSRLKEAEALVLLFPTWWFGFPAMLKGWFDRVWGPGIAYDHANDFGPIKPRLDNLKKVLVVTTLGSPWWIDRLVMWQPVKRIMKLALLGACIKKSKLQFLSLYNSEKLNEQRISAFKSKIEKALDTWRE